MDVGIIFDNRKCFYIACTKTWYDENVIDVTACDVFVINFTVISFFLFLSFSSPVPLFFNHATTTMHAVFTITHNR